MKVLQLDFVGIGKLKHQLDEINQWKAAHASAVAVFEIFAKNADRTRIELLCEIIEQEMPDALFLGCSSKGNIVNGENSASAVNIVCTLIESPLTRVRLHHSDFSAETLNETAEKLKQIATLNPWIKGIWALMTSHGMTFPPFRSALKGIRSSLQIFGAGASTSDSKDNHYVFSKHRGFTPNGGVFLMMGGESLDFFTEELAAEKLPTLAKKLTDFGPDSIRIFANTKLKEIPIKNIAPTSGFYSDGIFCGLDDSAPSSESIDYAVALKENRG